MTQETAKKVFDILLSSIRMNGFTDIGTFVIDRTAKDQEFEEFHSNYEYVDTERAILNLEKLSSNPNYTFYALSRLIEAGLEYFNLASKIPERYASKINNLTSKQRIKYKINMQGINEETINIDAKLRSKKIQQIIIFLEKIRIGLDMDDKTFLKSF
ncbi:hypothetical protein FE904_06965 [Chryseobacterium indologenes]|uniref:hypothetical protein n=1 Tax=Chryseobacterium indologenes TaxID=253 RepID=UPI001109F99C|nr:hypothetical protein [Chryseobacterium indologenes]TLX26587.1 hypothetical protein FE904_06965 [Chryseobacterium indologenes]